MLGWWPSQAYAGQPPRYLDRHTFERRAQTVRHAERSSILNQVLSYHTSVFARRATEAAQQLRMNSRPGTTERPSARVSRYVERT